MFAHQTIAGPLVVLSPRPVKEPNVLWNKLKQIFTIERPPVDLEAARAAWPGLPESQDD